MLGVYANYYRFHLEGMKPLVEAGEVVLGGMFLSFSLSLFLSFYLSIFLSISSLLL